MFYCYILECHHNKLYVGSCEDPALRFELHKNGKGASFTKQYPPIEFAYLQRFETRPEAMAREAQIKKWSRAKKQALIEKNVSQLKALSISRDHSTGG